MANDRNETADRKAVDKDTSYSRDKGSAGAADKDMPGNKRESGKFGDDSECAPQGGKKEVQNDQNPRPSDSNKSSGSQK